MSEIDESSPRRLSELITRLRRASRARFQTRPGSEEHRQAIDAELVLDHELDDAVYHPTAKPAG
jgi:hypothetical protein